MKARRATRAATLAILFAACSELPFGSQPGAGTFDVGELRVQTATLDSVLVAGRSVPLGVFVFDRDGRRVQDPVVEWSTSDGRVATVSPNGVVTGVAPGRAVITATVGVRSTGVAIVVVPPVASVVVDPIDPHVAVGDEVQLTATLRAADGSILTDRRVRWGSGAPSVASVSKSGAVRGQSVGTTIVAAQVEEKADTVRVTVTAGGTDPGP
jgi:uncharacterized protein YjdB